CCLRRQAKTSAEQPDVILAQAGIFHGGGDAAKVEMIQGVGCGPEHFKVGALAKFEVLADRGVQPVGWSIRQYVARGVAERGAKYGLGGTSVHDEVNIICRNNHRNACSSATDAAASIGSSRSIKCIDAQTSGGAKSSQLRSGDQAECPGVTSVDADSGDGSRGATTEHARRIANERVGETRVKVVAARTREGERTQETLVRSVRLT